ncbi:MAG: BamA/TamA family outer membrane protein [Saprospiraceae bacterium]|nr:BamA/TamA family outer membrane protein [Saprospiraceae bacterium]
MCIFSAGDIKLEANAEYRTDLFWRFKWAWFFDIGNVWLWPQSEGTPEAKFSKDFINQIAFNTGVGLRMDISFLYSSSGLWRKIEKFIFECRPVTLGIF